MKIVFVLIFLVLFLGANFYVFYRIWSALPPNAVLRGLLIALGSIAVLSFVMFFALSEVLPIGISSVLYKIGGSWFFIMIYLLIILLLENIIGLANRFVHFMPADALTRYTKENWVGMALISGFVALFMICGYMKYNWKVRVNIPLDIKKAINDSTTHIPLRVVAISDMHLGYGIDKKELEGWVTTINKEKPDVVLIAGDVIDNSVRPLNEDNFAEAFRGLNAPLGVYACVGNHEYISGIDKSLDFLKRSGVQVLRDSVVELEGGYYLVGRDDKSNVKRKPISTLVSSLDKSKPIILLDHQPLHLEEAEQNNIDLQISGHTHHGQVWPVSLITNVMYEKSHGLIKKGNSNIYVSSGIGLWGGKFRIGSQSEYVVIDINK